MDSISEKKNLPERNHHGESLLSKLPCKKDVSVPSQNMNHNFSDVGQKPAFQFSENGLYSTVLWFRNYKDSLRKTNCCYTQVTSKYHDPWRENIFVNDCVDEKTRIQGLLLISHCLCVFPVATTHFHIHNWNSYGHRRLSLCILIIIFCMPPRTSSKGALANSSVCQ